jgi:hypothetical protein
MTRRPALWTENAAQPLFVEGKSGRDARIECAQRRFTEMRRLFISLLFLFTVAGLSAQEPVLESTQESVQELRRSGSWSSLSGGGCIGGSTCKERRLRLPLEDRPVIAVRFRAHDQIGTKADGALRVKIDGNTVESHIDVPRKGDTFTLEVDELRGRYLVIEAASDDEVQVSDVAVLYGSMRRQPSRRDDYGGPRGGGGGNGPRGGGSGGWRSYPDAAGCIGGDECGRHGDRITIPLDNAPVLGIRFYAHDAIGTKADGRLTVRIDQTSIGWPIDVQRNGKRHELDVENVYGSKLVIETATDDEVDVKDIEVLYGARGRGPGGGSGSGPREMTHQGGCIGGSECGGRRARIRIPIDGRPVQSLRFYARDDIGTRAGGELRIRIDDEIIEYSLDIPREGRTFTIDGKGIEGEYIFIEPAEDDEVEVKDVRVRFGARDDD